MGFLLKLWSLLLPYVILDSNINSYFHVDIYFFIFITLFLYQKMFKSVWIVAEVHVCALKLPPQKNVKKVKKEEAQEVVFILQ